jgi:hypothetical protein
MDFLKAEDQAQVKKMMKEKPIIIFFHSTGCPHCTETMPYWKELCSKKAEYGLGDTKMISVGDEAIPDDEGISGVPHFRKISKSGKVTDVNGAKGSLDELVKSLKKMDGGSRRTRRRNTRRFIRRVRKTRHRR